MKIVLIIFGFIIYMIIGAVVSGVVKAISNEVMDDFTKVAIEIIWPIAVVTMVFWFMFSILDEIRDKVEEGVYKWISLKTGKK